MVRHRAATAWIFVLGIVLLVAGVWLATLTMKRSQRARTTKSLIPEARKLWTS